MSTVSRMTVSRRPSTRLPEDDGGWQSVGAMEFNKFKKKVAKKYLDVGTSAICVHNKGGHLYDVRIVWTPTSLLRISHNHPTTYSTNPARLQPTSKFLFNFSTPPFPLSTG